MIILMGKSASGKDTIAKILIERGYKETVSHTSRPMRPGEVKGKSYFFVTNDEFADLVRNGKMVEHRIYYPAKDMDPEGNGWFYGISRAELTEDSVVVLDPTGTRSVLAEFPGALVFLISADDDVRHERAMSRGGLTEEEWMRREADDTTRFDPEEISDIPHFVVSNNGEPEDTAEIIESIADGLAATREPETSSGRTWNYRYKQRKNHINRKLDIVKAITAKHGYGRVPGKLNKGKIHCSCPICAYGGWNRQDAKRRDQMDFEEKEAYSGTAVI